ncbi:protein GAMETE EXPRESSED 1-like [Pyrus ussuriensis x Pyrus communis]|uniref:Protein GAMETE EXPRESSED 1-like n=1 Tax=Pyrus ussuriensis x Pyrus communis TaxID=2448454 RepID=A0A5N5GDZ5_9ROSA|nr:protein GAMETE EXPRESSED 1-like [Pyrus ussuriensis x Pyrus communis]
MSWFWSSSSGNTDNNAPENLQISGDTASEFSMDSLNDEKGIERVNNARRNIWSMLSDGMLSDAYKGIFGACSDSGRSPFPTCRVESPMKPCLEKLDNDAIHTYRGFYLETNSICHQLQSGIFGHQTEKLVNDLKKSSDYAEKKLESIAEKADKLLDGSKDIHESLTSIEEQTQEIVKQSEAVLEQSKKIEASQLELQMGQHKMKENLESGMAMAHESYHILDKGIPSLQDETSEIEKKIGVVGETIKADDIGNVADISLERQKELLNGQSEALNGLQSPTKFQSQALKETQDHLVKNSKTILEAQEAFEQKQSSMFVALDRLFALQDALLVESRSMKAVVFYFISMLAIYMLTITKQTYPVRHWLYLFLCLAFMLEFAVLRFATKGIEQRTRWGSGLRNVYVLYAALNLLYACWKYKDYERLNYNMLQKLTAEVICSRKNAEWSWESDDDFHDESDWSALVDKDVSDDIEHLKDSKHLQEEVGDNLRAVSSYNGRYNLRSRTRSPI